ncbi:DNA repair protein RecO [Rothia sp. AR01]|uniref:DNA repair protein RecO n=1 Tax=Rothia santali TaxID=2949643 RepID=A0A9X2KGY0_9MICC|nr:DNA repair protein RecO [Rothia santali]MCP3424613.1 DNA repair protein RecO [Rothia santali]
MSTSPSHPHAYRDTLLILRTQQLGEADRIVIGISPRQGVVRAVAKGVRKSSSKLGARLEPFMFTDVSLAHGRNLETVTQAVTRRAYSAPVVADWDRYTSACSICEVAEQLGLAVEAGDPRLFNLTVGAVGVLARGEHLPDDVLTSYLLRAMAVSGWHVELDSCARCGSEGPLHSWSQADGGAICDACRTAGDRPLAEETLAYLRAAAGGRWDLLDADPEPGVRDRAGKLVRRYVQWHVEREFRSFSLLERPS